MLIVYSRFNHPTSIEGMTNKSKAISNFFNQKQETKTKKVETKEVKKESNGLHNFFEKIKLEKKQKTSNFKISLIIIILNCQIIYLQTIENKIFLFLYIFLSFFVKKIS